jgi:glycine cleavage system H lipoate-binding protein
MNGARLEANGTATVGISDHDQEALGDVVAIELKEVGQVLATGDQVGTVESLKAASDGASRRFQIKPYTGGRSITLVPSSGD